MTPIRNAITGMAIALLVGLMLTALPGVQAFGAPRAAAYGFEMHWGFVQALRASNGDPALLLPMDGRVTFTDGDPNTQEGIHLISGLLFERGGGYEAGEDDAIVKYAEMGSEITWRSSTTSDWDGIALSFRYEARTDPTVTIETAQWRWSGPISRLRELQGLFSIGQAGQQLEVGRFFTLSYRVYDLVLAWGFNETVAVAQSGQPLRRWEGSLELSAGGIRLLQPLSFERTDLVRERADLSSTLGWSSTTFDGARKAAAVDGLAVNLIAPQGTNPMLTIAFAVIDKWTFELPARFRDVHQMRQLDDRGHSIHLHLHWCWFKKS